MTLAKPEIKADRLTPVLGVSTLLLMLAGLYIGLSAPPDVNQGTLVRLFFIHVPAAWLSYLAYGGTGLCGLLYLFTRQRRFDRLSASSAEIGLLFTVSTIIVGMMWAKPTWGAYWVWEPRLTTTALSLVIYGGYLLVRSLIEEPERRASLSAAYALVAFVTVPFLIFAVPRMYASLHPDTIINDRGRVEMSPDIKLVFFSSLAAFTALFFWIYSVDRRVSRLVREAALRRDERAAA